MPLASIITNVQEPTTEVELALLDDITTTLSNCFGKPTKWVMTCFRADVRMTFGGTREPAAYVEVKNIGAMSPAKAKEVSAAVTAAIVEHLGVPSDRVYLELADAQAHLWGYDGGTFA
jgi:phenylpyruvate tautomerase